MEQDTGAPDDGHLSFRVVDWYLWSWRIPELRLLPPGRARRAAFREAHRELSGMRGGLSWVLVLVWFVLLVLFAPGRLISPVVLAALTGVLVMSVFFDAPKLRELRTNVRGQISAAGLRLCMACGYDLRGVEGDACPECGGQSHDP